VIWVIGAYAIIFGILLIAFAFGSRDTYSEVGPEIDPSPQNRDDKRHKEP
jgi:hypothetical protein